MLDDGDERIHVHLPLQIKSVGIAQKAKPSFAVSRSQTPAIVGDELNRIGKSIKAALQLPGSVALTIIEPRHMIGSS